MHAAAQIKDFPGQLPTDTLCLKLRDADYLAVMCHEITTPLSSIIGLAHILTGEEAPEKTKKYAEMLRDSSNMLMELMKNMLDASRMEAGMLEIEHIDFNLAKLIQEVLHIIATRASDKGLNIYVNFAKELPLQWVGDPLRIRQILLNLLSNSVKFTEKGQVSLYVNTKRDPHGNDQLRITVADTGIGMSEESLKKIFCKYRQTDASISRNYGGTGLGLAISQQFAQLMDGNITVKSWPGMGSHFTVTLPLKKAAAFRGCFIRVR
jgi:signal transduction histidine kinase